VFVKNVERVMATGFIMVLCLLVYRLAEHRIHQRLAETGPPCLTNSKRRRSDLLCAHVFQCFEGISLVRLASLKS
jgi:transposase